MERNVRKNEMSEAYDVERNCHSQFNSGKELKFENNATRFFTDYVNNSSVHGIKYITQRHRHWSESVFWILTFVISLSACSKMIYDVYSKWQQSPVIVSFAEKSTPLYQIPFPAITICSVIKTSKSEVDCKEVVRTLLDAKFNHPNLTDLFNEDISKFKKFEAYLHLMAENLILKNYYWVHDIVDNSVLSPEEIVSTLDEIHTQRDGTISKCMMNENKMCIFSKILTDGGFCYTTNILNADELFRVEK